MKVRVLTVFLFTCLLLAGCKSDMRNVDSTALATEEPTIIITPTPSPTEPPIQAADILDEMKLALDEVQSYSIDEYFDLEVSGGMNEAYTRISSELDYTRTEGGFKVLGAERTDRDAGSNDKVTQYRIYVETYPGEDGATAGLHLETLATGAWSQRDWLPETAENLDHISRFYYIVENAMRCEYMDVELVDGVAAHVIKYTLSPIDMRNCFDMLERHSVPSALIGEDGLNDIMADTQLVAMLYIDEETMLPIKITIDYSPLLRAMLDKLGIKIEIGTAEGLFLIGEYDEQEVQVPDSLQNLYNNVKPQPAE